jgi:hypothetical protein
MATLKTFILRYGLIVMAAGMAVAAVGFYLSRPQANATAHPAVANPSPTLAPELPEAPSSVETSYQTPSVQSLPSLNAQDEAKQALRKTVDDIQVEVVSTKIVDTGVEITVCYATQDAGDWYPGFSHLFYGTSEIYPDSFKFLSEDRADGTRYGKRCVAVRYKIDEMDTITPPLQFGIEELYAVPREGHPCERFQERFDTNRIAKAYGLKVQCSEVDDGAQASVELVDYDQKVDQDTAKQAFNAIIQGSLTGPWMFTIPEIQK